MVRKFSIIIPVYNEENINKILSKLKKLDSIEKAEIIVVDGNKGSTIKKIKDKSIKKFISEKGRAKQMNYGAKKTKGEILIFLHADTILPKKALIEIEDVFNNKNYVAGAFNLKLDSKNLFLNVVSFATSIRAKLVRIPYGDQAIFIRKSYFNKIGGYKELPFLEDVDLMKRIRKSCDCIKIIEDSVITSARRWEENGMFKTTYTNRKIMFFYMLGFSPEKLAEIYRKKK